MKQVLLGIMLASLREDAPLPKSIFYVLVILLSLMALGLIPAFILAFHQPKKRANELIDFNVRVYQYDFSKRSFSFFDQNNLANQKVYDENQFYGQFTPTDKLRVQNWLDQIAQNNPDYPSFLQAEIRIRKHGNALSTALLTLTGINYEKSIVHFESRLLPYIPSFTEDYRKKRKQNQNTRLRQANSKRLKKYALADKPACQKFIDSATSNQVIGVLSLKLYRQGGNRKGDDEYLAGINRNIRNYLSRFLKKSVRYYPLSPLETLIIDCDSHTKTMVMTIANGINQGITQLLNFSVEDTNLYVAIGMTTGSLSNRNIENAIHQTDETTTAIASGYTSDKVLFYDPSFFTNYHLEQQNLSDVRKVVENMTYQLYFMASVDTASWKQDFYRLWIRPYGTKLQNFFQLLDIARKIETGNGPAVLFADINRRVERKLEGSSCRNVLLPLPYKDVKAFLAVMKEEASDLHWILAIRENDFMAMLDDLGSIKKTIAQIEASGYRFALILHNANTALPSSILRRADYFVVGERFTADLNDAKTRNDLRLIQSNYKGFKGVISYLGLKDDNDFELAIHYGARIIQCASLSGTSSLPEVLEKKKTDRLMEVTKDLVPRETSPKQALEKIFPGVKPLFPLTEEREETKKKV